jgi:hypothetical protein
MIDDVFALFRQLKENTKTDIHPGGNNTYKAHHQVLRAGAPEKKNKNNKAAHVANIKTSCVRHAA